MQIRSMLVGSLLMTLCALGFSSCHKIKGSGPLITETRSLNSFHSISLSIDADVLVKPDSIFHIEISAQENILRYLRTRIDDQTLCIDYGRKLFIQPTLPVQIIIYVPEIRHLSLNGSGKMILEEDWATSAMHVELNGSGNIHIYSLDASNLQVDISGSGMIELKEGTAIEIRSNLSGSGTMNLLGIIGQKVFTETNGSGTTYVHAQELLNAEINGSGDVYYRGHPHLETHINGSGKVQAIP